MDEKWRYWMSISKTMTVSSLKTSLFEPPKFWRQFLSHVRLSWGWTISIEHPRDQGAVSVKDGTSRSQRVTLVECVPSPHCAWRGVRTQQTAGTYSGHRRPLSFELASNDLDNKIAKSLLNPQPHSSEKSSLCQVKKRKYYPKIWMERTESNKMKFDDMCIITFTFKIVMPWIQVRKSSSRSRWGQQVLLGSRRSDWGSMIHSSATSGGERGSAGV